MFVVRAWLVQGNDIRFYRGTWNHKAPTTFVVVTPRDCKLTDGTAGDGTQSEYNSKRKVYAYHRPDEGL